MIKSTTIMLWNQVAENRAGVPELINFLTESDYFSAPCSTKYHLPVKGGLAKHSLNVFNLLKSKVEQFGVEVDVPWESIVICGLGHDLCKINLYQEGGEPCSAAQYSYLCSLWERSNSSPPVPPDLLDGNKLKREIPAAQATLLIDWLKNRPFESCPELPIVFSINDQLPLGHGEKSLSILQDFIKLTDEEKLAIRWHMAAWDLSESGKYAFNNAKKITPLVALLSSADFEACNILEIEEE